MVLILPRARMVVLGMPHTTSPCIITRSSPTKLLYQTFEVRSMCRWQSALSLLSIFQSDSSEPHRLLRSQMFLSRIFFFFCQCRSKAPELQCLVSKSGQSDTPQETCKQGRQATALPGCLTLPPSIQRQTASLHGGPI